MSDRMQPPEKKSSFYIPLLLLRKERREALALLYRFCRSADDLSDEPGEPGEKRRRFTALAFRLSNRC